MSKVEERTRVNLQLYLSDVVIDQVWSENVIMMHNGTFVITSIYINTKQVEAELEEVVDRLEEQDGANAAQVDLTKKRENELVKLKRDLEEARMQNEQSIAQMRKKQNDAVSEMADQLDQANKARAK